MDKEHEHLYRISKNIISKEILPNELLFEIQNALNCEYCMFAKYKEFLQEVDIQILNNKENNLIEPKELNSLFINPSDPLYDQCITNKYLINLNVDDNSELINQIHIPKLEARIISILSIPLINNDVVIGMISAINKINSHTFTNEDEKLITIFSTMFTLHQENIKLKEENKSKERLSKLGQSIINSAHGLKNILNNIDGGVFIAEKGTIKKDMDEVTKGWEILRRNSNRVRDLVLDILLYSRPKKPEYKLCNVNAICRDLKELMKSNAESSDVKIKLILDDEIKPLFLDPKGIYRCILNLISNAIWACKEKKGGEVTITTKLLKDNRLEITVTDTGTGISQENLDNIFATFFTTKGSQGTGLGLSVTQKIIKEHRGTIDVVSTLNVGTTFTILIPIKVFNEKSIS